jgi:hypothetical protein
MACKRCERCASVEEMLKSTTKMLALAIRCQIEDTDWMLDINDKNGRMILKHPRFMYNLSLIVPPPWFSSTSACLETALLDKESNSLVYDETVGYGDVRQFYDSGELVEHLNMLIPRE